jgi:hypothetical protein
VGAARAEGRKGALFENNDKKGIFRGYDFSSEQFHNARNAVVETL